MEKGQLLPQMIAIRGEYNYNTQGSYFGWWQYSEFGGDYTSVYMC